MEVQSLIGLTYDDLPQELQDRIRDFIEDLKARRSVNETNKFNGGKSNG